MLFCAILWVTEAIPLWVTSMSIPLIVVCGKIILSPNGQPVPAHVSASALLMDLMDPTVVLILGGFCIAAALHKYHIDERISMMVLSIAGGSATLFLLVLMLLGVFLSMWVSNVASPVLLVFLVTPMLREVRDTRFCKCIALGISMSCNIGGMMTPIASPQNAVALQALSRLGDDVKDISFVKWMSVSTPVCVALTLCAWVYLVLVYRPKTESLPNLQVLRANARNSRAAEAEAKGLKHLKHQGLNRPTPEQPELDNSGEEPFTWRHWYVVFVTLLTISLWCTFHYTKDFFGKLGLIGLIPVILIFSADILQTEDFNSLDWNILMLLGGGAALGTAVKDSDLLRLVAKNLSWYLRDQSLYVVFATFNGIIMLVTNFISHTVGAMTTLPIVAAVGESLGHSRLLVFSGVLSCSAASCLPVSSFPNIIVYSMKNGVGESYLSMGDYLKSGIAFQLFFQAVMLSLGWYMLDEVQDF